jgi:hypothetical protein
MSTDKTSLGKSEPLHLRCNAMRRPRHAEPNWDHPTKLAQFQFSQVAAIRPDDPYDVRNNNSSKSQPSDTRGGSTVNRAYYEAIAQAAALGCRIVEVGRVTVADDDGHQLVAYLGTHDPAEYNRLACEVIADLPHLSQSQLIQFCQDDFTPAGASAAAHCCGPSIPVKRIQS